MVRPYQLHGEVRMAATSNCINAGRSPAWSNGCTIPFYFRAMLLPKDKAGKCIIAYTNLLHDACGTPQRKRLKRLARMDRY